MDSGAASTQVVLVAVAAVVEKVSSIAGAAPTPSLEALQAAPRQALRVLITLRRAEGVLGGLWELPGGKVEPGEAVEHALVRELR